MVGRAGGGQVRLASRFSFLIPILLLASTFGCVEVEVPNANTEGVTPSAVPSREAPAPATETPPALASPSATPSLSLTPGCEAAVPSIPTATSSRDSTTPAPSASAQATSSSQASPTDATGTPDTVAASPRLSSPRGVPPPESPAPLAIRTDLVLENALKLLLGENLNGYGVVAIDLESGRSISINGDLIFYSASIFKTWVMYEVFHQASLGYFSLTDQLVMTPYYDAFGLGPRATQLCQRITVEEALEAMMSISDNAAAVLLQDLVGAPNVNSSMEALGLKDSRLNTDDIPVTANDMALLLQFIGSGKAVNRDASQAMAALMLTEGFNNGLTSGVPGDVEVAHKTGNWPNARHDIGIVFAPETTYVIAVLSDNRPGSQAMIQAISTAVYDSFNR